MTGAVLVRLPADLATHVEGAADRENLSVAGWLRQCAAVTLGASPEERRPSSPRRGIPPEDVVAIARLREAVGHATGALVRSAAFTRHQGDMDTHSEFEALVRVFRRHALDLDLLKARLMGGTAGSR